MSARQALTELIDSLPEERLAEMLEFARFLLLKQERDDWRRFGQEQLARAYGNDEPDYNLDDIRQERQ